MGTELEWRTSNQEPTEPGSQGRQRWFRRLWLSLGLLAVLAVAVGLLYWLTQPSEAEVFDTVNLHLRTEQRAMASGDGALFRSMQAEDPAWLATQFLLIAEMDDVEKLRLLAAEQHGDDVWATVGWQQDGEARKRLTFFRWKEGRLQHGPPDPAYWGRLTTRSTDWGRLRLHRADRAWADAINAFVSDQIAKMCDQACLRERLPLELTVAGDFDDLPDKGTIRIPSPQLMGLSHGGAPAQPFWERLRDELRSQLQPATIRFAVPDDAVNDLSRLADDFMATQPEITVEIVPFSALPTEPTKLLQAVDGAYMMPTVELITTGQVRDLTPFSGTDADFAVDDFYRAVLDGVRWQSRLWAVPQSAQMRLVYYDEPSFMAAALSPLAYLTEIWQEPTTRPSASLPMQHEARDSWGFLDSSTDSLHAFASSHRCADAHDSPCADPIRAADLAAALTWYAAQVASEETMPDVTAMTEEERSFNALNWLSIPRAVLLWNDLPGFYEHYNQLSPVGVLPLSDVAPSAAIPLRINGGLISQGSDHPLAVWTWLRFLSRQRPIGIARSIPARRSVASEIDYWNRLPSPLRAPMTTSFNRAQAVGIEQQNYFEWEALAALMAGHVDVDELADEMVEPEWFQGRRKKE